MFRKAALAATIAFAPELPLREADAPLPPPLTLEERPLADAWTPKTAHLDAIVVRLGAVGAHTHANWVFYRLPFDSTKTDRLRAVTFTWSADSDPNVSALPIGSVCLPYLRFGPFERWTPYTLSGIGNTLSFYDHAGMPTEDPTILGINIPTRVANYVACGHDDRLKSPSFWHLDVSWEER